LNKYILPRDDARASRVSLLEPSSTVLDPPLASTRYSEPFFRRNEAKASKNKRARTRKHTHAAPRAARTQRPSHCTSRAAEEGAALGTDFHPDDYAPYRQQTTHPRTPN